MDAQRWECAERLRVVHFTTGEFHLSKAHYGEF